jgi:hypothetical protein
VRFLDVILHRCVNWLAGEDGSRSCLCMLDSNRSRAVDGVLFARSVCVWFHCRMDCFALSNVIYVVS